MTPAPWSKCADPRRTATAMSYPRPSTHPKRALLRAARPVQSAEWIAENAACILRAGGAEVKAYGRDWVRIAEDLPYAKLLAHHLATLPLD